MTVLPDESQPMASTDLFRETPDQEQEINLSFGPKAPERLADTGMEPEVLADLTLKLANTVPHFTAAWAAERLCLPQGIVRDILDELVEEKMILIRGQAGPLDFRFAVTNQGQTHATRLMEVSAYVGPAPIPLETYTRMLHLQIGQFPKVSARDVVEAISELVLPEEVKQIAGLAASSGRSLFIYGPPGNGKTSLGSFLHRALGGQLWIPYCISVGSHVIRLFDPQCHVPIPLDDPSSGRQRLDGRWLRIQRPFIIVGGELTLESLDLRHGYSRGFYEAPLHVKANGGIFMIDDFGCQHVAPDELVNRWIVPLEHNVDYLTLQTGQQIEMPFQQLLIISTNLDPSDVTTPGMLRRLGYRLYLGDPTPEAYRLIFERYCAKFEIEVPSGLVDRLFERYQREDRPLRSCESRDLIERAKDICLYQGQPTTLSEEVMDLAWKGYFANEDALS